MKRTSVAIISSVLVFITTSTTSFANVVIDKPSYYNNYGYSLGKNIYKSNIQESVTINVPTTNQKDLPSKSNVTLKEYVNNYDHSYILPLKIENSNQNNNTTEETKEEILNEQKKLLDLINDERIKVGLPVLKLNIALCEIATQKSKDMFDNNYFSHNSPSFGKTSNLVKSQGITYNYFGENIARTYSIYKAHNGFMNSEGHKANILNKNYDEIGIGIVGNYYTEIFIGN